MKIVYCLNSIRYLGGIQRVTIVKANALAEVPGNEVFIIVTDNTHGPQVHPLSPKVQLVDLGVNYYEDDWKSRWHVLKGIVVKRKEHKKRLAEALHRIQPDIVVSVGQSEKYMLTSIPGNWVKIRELHFTKTYRKLHASSFMGRVSAAFSDFYDYSYKIKQYDKIVLLTREDKETNWNSSDKIAVIPNPASFVSNVIAPLNNKKIITTGRLELPKNYVSLIRAFRLVADKHPDWVLEIYGEGSQRKELEALITELRLNRSVYLKGYTSNVQAALADASCFVLSSIFEGLPLVLVEAMFCGLPVVSYACPCGPKDIITEGVDGFVVPINDEKALAEKICYLIEYEDIRKEMGKAAQRKAEQYRIEPIVQQWMDLFNELLNKKRQ